MRHARSAVALILLVLVVAAGWGIWRRHAAVASLATVADEQAAPAVTLIAPGRGPAFHELTLPGNIDAWYQAPIFGQVSGYVKMWYEDIGARVHKGDLLAVIETPGLDEQVAQAAAQLSVAEARYQLAAVTAERWKRLSGTQAVAQQDVDVKLADARAQKAEVDVARSSLGRLQALEGFKRIVAPFDGVVTARLTDIGNYVNAGGATTGSSGAGSQLFTVSDVHRLRVFVSVPQDYATELKPGVTATLSLPGYPDQVFQASFMTTSRSVSSQSRTVLTELEMTNPSGVLPGAFTEVHFHLPADRRTLTVPEQALLFQSRGMEVALVVDGRVRFRRVALGRNLGARVEILSGLRPGDRLIANPSLGLLEGEQVNVVHVPAAEADDENEQPELAEAQHPQP